MPVTRGHSFLVHPSKAAEIQPNIGGVEMEHSGKVFNMLFKIFDNSHMECNIEISFQPDAQGQQKNDCHALLQTYLKRPNIQTARKIAERLQSVTTHRSGLGLLFLLGGTDKNGARLLVARFPADEGVVAREKSSTLSLEVFGRVFMENAKSYKSVVDRAGKVKAGF